MEDELLALLKEAVTDSIIELECKACGGTLRCEPDAQKTYCYECEKVVPTHNPLIELGLI
jgi:hypothetical protein